MSCIFEAYVPFSSIMALEAGSQEAHNVDLIMYSSAFRGTQCRHAHGAIFWTPPETAPWFRSAIPPWDEIILSCESL
jgi:hypothetical protein